MVLPKLVVLIMVIYVMRTDGRPSNSFVASYDTENEIQKIEKEIKEKIEVLSNNSYFISWQNKTRKIKTDLGKNNLGNKKITRIYIYPEVNIFWKIIF